MTANVYTIPPSAPFAETLARGLIERTGGGPFDLADTTIFLPTRRAQRTFGDTFARILGGAALLPQFKALGDADEDELVFAADTLDLEPAIAPMRRTLLMASLVQRWHARTREGHIGFAQAAALAEGLAATIDEIQTQGADLGALEGFIPAPLAAHWENIRRFLLLMHEEWPKLLEREGRIDPAERRNRALASLAERMRTAKGPVIAAGSTGSIPATADLLRAIAERPDGAVILPGLDRNLDVESWNALDPGHPQFGMQQLLLRLDVPREAVKDWDSARNTARETVLRETLRPAPMTDAWRAIADGSTTAVIAQGMHGVSAIEAADPMEEATVIALVLREAMEDAGTMAALVTPDRGLARRVAAELKRWEIDADDSAGRPLSHTLPGTFLCLLADAAESGFAPVPLLALLKHPLCTLGGDAASFRDKARELDGVLRGPRPDPGLDGIRKSIRRARVAAGDVSGRQRALTRLNDWFAEVAAALEPLEALSSEPAAPLPDIVRAHLAAAEALARKSELWRAEAGEAAALFVQELIDASVAIEIDTGAYASLFRKLAGEKAVRLQRTGHPRVAILGPLEARLQHFDTVVLGGLNEGSWPRAAAADPWFSRPMRNALGLEQPERAIGQSAHDFATLCAGPRVVLTRAKKAEGAPTVASRWLERLTQLLGGLGLKETLPSQTDYAAIARRLADAGRAVPEERPAPKPPVAARPKGLSVTEIERWVRDPYAVYARRVLSLKALEPLEAEIGPLERGNAVHEALERFVVECPGPLPADAVLKLVAIADKVFADHGVPKAALALWRPRFANAAAWFVEIERAWRAVKASVRTEIKGRWPVTEEFTLSGVADRIDIRADGSAAIFDYKTGKPPTKKQIEAFLAPQLLLEAEMLRQGAFGDPCTAAELLYVWFSGGRKPGDVQAVDVGLVPEAVARLKRYIGLFAMPSTPYLPRLRPQNVAYVGDYDHLARVREWSLGGWEAPDE